MNLRRADHVALSDAIEAGDLVAVRVLIQQHPELIGHSSWAPPPLHCAVHWNQPQIAELLLDNGADIEVLDPDRQTTPLRYAVMYCKTDLILMLLQRGANTGPIVENGSSLFQLAKNAANGDYEGFGDLPPRDEYRNVVTFLEQQGFTA